MRKYTKPFSLHSSCECDSEIDSDEYESILWNVALTTGNLAQRHLPVLGDIMIDALLKTSSLSKLLLCYHTQTFLNAAQVGRMPLVLTSSADPCVVKLFTINFTSTIASCWLVAFSWPSVFLFGWNSRCKQEMCVDRLCTWKPFWLEVQTKTSDVFDPNLLTGKRWLLNNE